MAESNKEPFILTCKDLDNIHWHYRKVLVENAFRHEDQRNRIQDLEKEVAHLKNDRKEINQNHSGPSGDFGEEEQGT